ncbi:MAG: dTDP-4-amino-4,6-dideoxygalactose transaminase [Bacteriovoracaceae bacterium]|jgi:dTDP-4-amino-4,6-dideoxygalactose transaminase
MPKTGLAIFGGDKVKKTSYPPRKQFGEDELSMVEAVFQSSWDSGSDFGYQGDFEKKYTDNFCTFQGGGYADAVSSGTVAIFIALAALDLDKGSEVIVSPITDPGGVSPVLMNGMTPVLCDSAPGSYNVDLNEIKKVITDKTRAVVITHMTGVAVNIEPIVEYLRDKGIKVLEDCSQAHGASISGKKVGTFGDIAAFSTMYSKNHSTGGCGGVIYTSNYDLYRRVRYIADRGKEFDAKDFDSKNANRLLFPALNFNLDEVSCAIGISTLKKLPLVIKARNQVKEALRAGLRDSKVCSFMKECEDSISSPFFQVIKVDSSKISCTKIEFANAIKAEGASINPDYQFVTSQWDWVKPYLKAEVDLVNAREIRDSSFNILFHEKYQEEDINDIILAIKKVESFYLR